jgi:hypothetical protein
VTDTAVEIDQQPAFGPGNQWSVQHLGKIARHAQRTPVIASMAAQQGPKAKKELSVARRNPVAAMFTANQKMSFTTQPLILIVTSPCLSHLAQIATFFRPAVSRSFKINPYKYLLFNSPGREHPSFVEAVA